MSTDYYFVSYFPRLHAHKATGVGREAFVIYNAFSDWLVLDVLEARPVNSAIFLPPDETNVLPSLFL